MAEELLTSLQTHFGFSAFRPGQREALQSLLNGQHTLVIMPTGAGKSLVYQLAALHCPGVTLVLSPLIALMKDQVDGLTRRNLPATFINSAIPSPEQTRRLQALAQGDYRLVYVAPERLRNTAFMQAVQRISIGLLAVDEAHCLSQWGHDFRPDYLHIAAARQQLGDPLLVALTATATPQVQDDVVRLLQMPSAQRIVTGFNRPNLSFEVRYAPDATAKLQTLQSLLADLRDGAAIIYAGTRRECEEIAEFVRAVCERQVGHYHAGLAAEARTRVQEDFMHGKLPIVVATNAFGMGIDRADVRLVAHFNVPGTLEAYYQEAGRAGRDGNPAKAVLLYDPKDRALQEWFIENDAPGREEIRALYAALPKPQSAEAWIALDELLLRTGFSEVKIKVGLAQLEMAGIVQRLGDEGPRMLLRLEQWNDKAVQETSANVQARRRHRHKQLHEMVNYAESNNCRRRLLLDHFGDNSPAEATRCCDNCLAQQVEVVPTDRGDFKQLDFSEQVALIILDAVRRLEWEVGREKLAQMLKGSRAKDMLQFGYHEQPYYGRLAQLQIIELEDCIAQLVEQKYLKAVGGNRPVLRLTPQGEAMIKARTAISLRIPARLPESEVSSKPAQKAGSDTATPFPRGLSSEASAKARAQRVVALGEETLTEHVPELIAALQDEDGNVRRLAASALGKIEDHRAVAPLLALLQKEEKPQVRQYAVKALGRIGDPHGRTALEKIAADDNEIVYTQTAARHVLRRLTPAADLTSVANAASESLLKWIAALENADRKARLLAISELVKLGDQRAVEPLMILLEEEENSQVRRNAIKALERLGDSRARRLMEKIAANPRERDEVRVAAGFALENLPARIPTAPDDTATAPAQQTQMESEKSSPSQTEKTEETTNAIADFLVRPHPRPLQGNWDCGWALGFHSGFAGADWNRSAIGELTYRFKYQQEASALPAIVEHVMALRAAHPEFFKVDALLPAPPSTPRAHDPVSAWAEALSQKLGLPVWRVLTKTRITSPQKEMHNAAQKRANVAGAFAARSAVAGKGVLVLDDLFDSGATLEELTRVLRQAGATKVHVLTLTRTIHVDA